MHRIYPPAMLALFIVGTSLPAWGQVGTRQRHEPVYSAPMPAENPALSSRPAEEGGQKIAAEAISGTIRDIDRRHGRLTMTTDQNTTLALQFPPDSLRGIQAGDAITAHMSFARVESQQGAHHAYDLPKTATNQPLLGKHHVSGVITNVNRNTGVVGLKAGKEDLTLQFPPDAVSNLNGGARVDVTLAFARGRMPHGQGAAAPAEPR